MNFSLGALKSKLKAAGIESEIFRLNKRWYALKVFNKSAGHWFWVRHSSRGWFLGDREVFHVPDPSKVLQLCAAWATDLGSRSRLIVSFELELQSSWMQDESSSENEVWRSIGWHPLSDSECTSTFDAFEKQFSYPSDHFSPNPPTATWDLSHLYDYDLCEFKQFSEQLNQACLTSLRQCLPKSEGLIALDWNHCGYRLETISKLETDASEMWPISVFPDGDYHMFVAPDFRLGIVSDPSGVICAYGQQLPLILKNELSNPPLMVDVQSEAL